MSEGNKPSKKETCVFNTMIFKFFIYKFNEKVSFLNMHVNRQKTFHAKPNSQGVKEFDLKNLRIVLGENVVNGHAVSV